MADAQYAPLANKVLAPIRLVVNTQDIMTTPAATRRSQTRAPW
jgi:hypothetical protein